MALSQLLLLLVLALLMLLANRMHTKKPKLEGRTRTMTPNTDKAEMAEVTGKPTMSSVGSLDGKTAASVTGELPSWRSTLPLGWTQVKRKMRPISTTAKARSGGGMGGWMETKTKTSNKRRRKASDGQVPASGNTNLDAGDEGDYFCDGPSCGPRWHTNRGPIKSKTMSTTKANQGAVANDAIVSGMHDGDGAANETTKSGRAIFCLLGPNPSWVQGYFVPKKMKPTTKTTKVVQGVSFQGAGVIVGDQSNSAGRNKPWGMLATQQEIDECLQCADGGYRRLNLDVFPYGRHSSHASNAPGVNANNKITLRDIDWTGGDMMRLCSDGIFMEAEKIYTGPAVATFMERYFFQLVCNLLQRHGETGFDTNNGDGDGGANDATNAGNIAVAKRRAVRRLLALVPDIAIVVGAMELDMTTMNNEDSKKL